MYAPQLNSMKISRIGPPAPRLNANEFQVKSAPGQQTSLIINADGYPYPNYTWSAKGKPLPSSKVQSLESMSMLTILDVHPEDFGEYTLTMSNALGTYIANYSLAPYGGKKTTLSNKIVLNKFCSLFRQNISISLI